MAEYSQTLALIKVHATVLQSAISRHVGNAVRCRQWNAALVALVFLLALSGVRQPLVIWVLAPVALLALVDASEVALARRFTDAYNRFVKELPQNGGNPMKADGFLLPQSGLGLGEVVPVLRALGSFSIWPFYGGLLAVLMTFHFQTVQLASATPHGTALGAPPATGSMPGPPVLPPQPQPGTHFPPIQPTRPPFVRFPSQNPPQPPQGVNGVPLPIRPSNLTPPLPPANR